MTYRQITICPVALDGGGRCTSTVIGGFGWRRCDEHRRWSLGLNLSPKQKEVLYWIAGFDSKPDRTPARIRQSAQGLARRELIEIIGGEYIITPWGRDVAGGPR